MKERNGTKVIAKNGAEKSELGDLPSATEFGDLIPRYFQPMVVDDLAHRPLPLPRIWRETSDIGRSLPRLTQSLKRDLPTASILPLHERRHELYELFAKTAMEAIPGRLSAC